MTTLISNPVDSIHGDICVPGDKSISHRAVILGSIANGVTTVEGFLDGQDCLATVDAFRAMGVTIEQPQPTQLVIQGVGKYGLQRPKHVIDCGNSGTSMRLLAGLLAAQSFDSELTGDASLLKRPMERVSRPLNLMRADITTHDGKAPLIIRGGQQLQGIQYALPESSSQVKSCIMLAGMYATGETQIIESGVTRDHTERMLSAFSYPVHKLGNAITIHSAGECLGTSIHVPGDISSAAFFIVAASIIPNSEITIHDVGVNSTRMGVIPILTRMGAKIELRNKRLWGEEPVADVFVRYAPLEGIDVPMSLVSSAIDEFPIIFIAAACAKGQTLLHGAKELRHKESDRIHAMVKGLVTLGIDAQPFDDGVFIQGGTLRGGTVDSYDDHRIAMAFSIAGCVAQDPVTILNCDNIATSFPHFIERTKTLNMNIKAGDVVEESML